MKKLIVTLVGALTLVFLVGSCGTDTECLCEDPLKDFFEEYYSECIQLCKTCADWSKMCGEINYDINVCVEAHWYRGDGNISCTNATTLINNDMVQGNCPMIKYWECFPQDYME